MRWDWRWTLNPGVVFSVFVVCVALIIAWDLPWWGAFIAGYIAASIRVDIKVR